jgi:hypothetical protein
MAQMTISIPDALQERMQRVQSVDWSALASAAFAAKLGELDAVRDRAGRQKKAESLLAGIQAELSAPAELEDVAQSRSVLLDRIAAQAQWRDRKAMEYPDDRRNSHSAACLQQLAGHLGGIPPGDTLWVRYHLAWPALEDVSGALESANDLEGEALRTYGFHAGAAGVTPAEALEFLQGIVEGLEEILAEGRADQDAGSGTNLQG